jgi:hypothetical protein
MAHSLGIIVIAEGVEREGQYELLRERDCDWRRAICWGIRSAGGLRGVVALDVPGDDGRFDCQAEISSTDPAIPPRGRQAA